MTHFREYFRCAWKEWVFCSCWLWCSVLSIRSSWLIHTFLFPFSLNYWDWNVKIPKHNWCTRLNGGGCSVAKSGLTLWDPLDCSTPGFPFICYLSWFAQTHVHSGNSLVAQMVKNLPAMQETRVWFLGQQQPLEKGITTYSSILAWGIPCSEKPGRLQSIGFSSKHYIPCILGFPGHSVVKNPFAMQETHVWSLDQEEPPEEGMATHSSTLAWRIPRMREAWWATVHRVARSWTQLKWLSIQAVHWVGDAIQPSSPPLLPSVFPSIRGISNELALHQVAKVLELQLQHQSFQWTFRVDFL